MPITRRRFLSTLAAGTAGAAAGPHIRAAAPSQRPKRPNLLLLWTDQHRGDCLPYAGNKVVKAPHLEALSEKSFVFNQAYCGQPVCTPSRGCILTGQYPHNHGAYQNNIPLPKDKKTLAEYLPAEYLTAYYGKWHLGSEITPQHGWSDWRSIEDKIYRDFYADPEDRKKRSSYHHFLWNNGFPPDDKDNADGGVFFSRTMAAAMAPQFTKSHFLAGEAEKFLHARKDGQPFVLSVNTLEPHPPTYGSHNDQFPLDSLPTGPAWGKPVGLDASKLARNTYDGYRKKGYEGHDLSKEWDRRRLRANYYGQISLVDDAFGRVLRALEESGQADNTIIVYTSDHGDMNGDHNMVQKSVFYEQASHIPLMVHIPWLSRGRVRLNGQFSLVDLTPTLLDLLGCAPSDAPFDGESRAEAFADPGSWKNRNIMIEWHDGDDHACDGRCIRTADNWKLNLYRGDGPELYVLNTDPGELRNVASDPANRGRINDLAAEIKAWQQRHRDQMPLRT